MGCISIIADDLTGASDTGIQFRKYGLKTKVIVDHDELIHFLEANEILSINSNTRSLKGDEAYKRVHDICCLLKRAGFTRIYKKVDSTFRGNPGVELEAVMDALGSKLAILAPAFPDNGRCMIGGYLKVVPITDKTIINEAFELSDTCDQKQPHIPSIVQKQMKRKVASIGLETVRQGIPAILNEVEGLCNKGYQVMVVDAVTRDDLKNIAFACKALPKDTVMAGAAGFAYFLPVVMDLPSKVFQKPSLKEGIILVVAGTCNPTTGTQIDEVIKSTRANLIKIDTDKIIHGMVNEEESRVVKEIQTIIESEKSKTIPLVVAVDTLFKRSEDDDFSIKKWGKTIATVIGNIVGTLVDEKLVQSLVVTGGDTALHVLKILKVKGIQLEEEVLAGIPAGRLLGGKAHGIPIVTKAGGFGTPRALVEVIEHLEDHTET